MLLFLANDVELCYNSTFADESHKCIRTTGHSNEKIYQLYANEVLFRFAADSMQSCCTCVTCRAREFSFPTPSIHHSRDGEACYLNRRVKWNTAILLYCAII